MQERCGLAACLLLFSMPCVCGADDFAGLAAQFGSPPLAYSSAPFWVWNDLLTEEQVRGTLRDFAAQHVRQAFAHPRPGLMTPYLSPDWFRLFQAALDEAGRLGMDVWIYDENSYPSGFAGGFVPEALPEAGGRGLGLTQTEAPRADDATIAIFRVTETGCEDVTAAARAGQPLPVGNYVVASLRTKKPQPWFAGKTYVDLLRPGVTEKFLELTLDAYRREAGAEFGKRVPGVFTDEPHLAPAGGLHWGDYLPGDFERRWGYRLLDNLPALAFETGDWRRVRHNYFQLLLELFVERWAKPYHDYCARNGLEMTGHYWEHSFPECTSAPDNMAMSAWQQRPGIDILFNNYAEDANSQFGNVRAVVELASVANQTGAARTLCETYGGSGWDLRFEDMKRIGDWTYVLGVNTLNEHLSLISLRGARKRDYPPSFSSHAPWWEAYHVMADYFTRLSWALTRGEQVNTILLLEPATTVWMYQTTRQDLRDRIGEQFQRLCVELAQAQVEYDIGSEDIIARHGGTDGAGLVVGRRRYDTVVIPPLTENLNTRTVELLEEYLKAGGTVVSCAEPIPRMDGAESPRTGALSQQPSWTRVEPDALAATLAARAKPGFAIRRAAGDKGVLYHHRRRLSGGDLVFLVNTSMDAPAAGHIESAARSVRRLDAESGGITPYPWSASDAGLSGAFTLPPCGSLLLFLSEEPGAAPPEQTASRATVAAAGPVQIRRTGLNVLTLDYLDVSAGGETLSDAHYSRAARFAFARNGMERNPWEGAVQFRDELIGHTFPAESGCEATYRFHIAGAVPQSLYFVVERPDLYTITCNSAPVAAEPGSWWLDRSFGKIDIAKVAQTGDNAVTLRAAPFTVHHELEAAYVLGDFAVEPVAKGFAVAPPRPLELGPWNAQGCALYGHTAAYTEVFDIAAPSGSYAVTLPRWYGSVARVDVNGACAGYIYRQPWELDVTRLIQPGSNTIEVTVFGTLKNTLGPHHGGPPLGFASPGSFDKGPESGPPPGAEYSTVAYGLFEPFVLTND